LGQHPALPRHLHLPGEGRGAQPAGDPHPPAGVPERPHRLLRPRDRPADHPGRRRPRRRLRRAPHHPRPRHVGLRPGRVRRARRPEPPGPRHPHHRGVPRRRREAGLRLRTGPDEEAAPGPRSGRRGRDRRGGGRAADGLRHGRCDTPMSPRAGSTRPHTLAFVESPVQLLNVLEWAHAHAPGADLALVVLSPVDPMTRGQLRRMCGLAREEGHQVRWEEARGGPGAPLRTVGGLTAALRRADRVVLGDPFSRYVQLLPLPRAPAPLVVDDGTATIAFVGDLARVGGPPAARRRARRVVLGAPFPRDVQLLTLTRAPALVVVDDGTATMEFVGQLARGERLVRWHRKGGRPGPRDLLLAPVSGAARRRLTPGGRRTVEVFSAMPVDATPPGVTVRAHTFAWTPDRL